MKSLAIALNEAGVVASLGYRPVRPGVAEISAELSYRGQHPKVPEGDDYPNRLLEAVEKTMTEIREKYGITEVHVLLSDWTPYVRVFGSDRSQTAIFLPHVSGSWV